MIRDLYLQEFQLFPIFLKNKFKNYREGFRAMKILFLTFTKKLFSEDDKLMLSSQMNFF